MTVFTVALTGRAKGSVVVGVYSEQGTAIRHVKALCNRLSVSAVGSPLGYANGERYGAGTPYVIEWEEHPVVRQRQFA